MPSVTYSSGGVKVNNAVSGSSSASRVNNTGTSTVTLYTAPSNGYAILNLYWTGSTTINNSGATASITVGGAQLYSISGGGSTSSQNVQTIYVGPSQSIVLSAYNSNTNTGTSASSTGYISGVEFVNS